MASLTVDGRTIEAQAGAPLVEVLKSNGVYVSSLCYIEGLKPYAGCRSCLVDIEGPPGLQLSCTAAVQDGMKVTTTSDDVKDARKAVLSLILANHSDRCLTCHRREHCHPGDICLRDDVVTHRCLTCSKNYRCELQATCEMVGMSGYEPWVGEERSFYQHPQPPADRANPFMEFDPQMCIICTRCQRACDEKRHTGAITLSGKGWDTMIAFGAGGAIDESNCDFSGACIDVCPTAALMEHPNKWVAKPDRWTSTTCDSCAVGCSIKIGSKDGRGVIVRPGTGNDFSGDQICVRGRYHYDSLKPRERLSRHLVRRGAILAPASLEVALSEAAAALKAAAASGRVGVLVGPTATNEESFLARAIAKSLGAYADSSLGPVMRATKSALEARLGTWRMATDMTALPRAKTIVVVADDLEESHNVASVRIKDAVAHHNAQLMVIGALRSELVDFATCWIRPRAGEEGQAAAELADAIAGRASLDAQINAAAGILRDAPRGDTFIVCAPNPVSPNRAGAMAGGAANLAVALFSNAASEHLVVLPPEVNVHGLLDLGIAASGGDNPLAGLAGLLVIRDDPTMRLPGAVEALSAFKTVIVLDGVVSESAKQASVVIAEGRAYASTGTYTQGDFRVQRLSAAIKPEGEAVSLFVALHGLARALGVEVPANPDAALVAIARELPQYQPAADLIVGEGVRLDMKGSGKGTIVPLDAAPAVEGLRVISGRDLYTAQDAASLHHPEAEKLHRYDRIQVSEVDGARLHIHSGDDLVLSAAGSEIRARLTVTDRVPEGAVFVSSLLQGGAVARWLTNGDIVATRFHGTEPTATTGPIRAAAATTSSLAPAPETSLAERESAVLSPSLNPVCLIKGVGPAREAALAAEGITTPADLLAVAGAPDGRKALAAKLGVSPGDVLEWVNRADLMRVAGVDFAFADLLENAGVDTVRELAARRPDNLHSRLTQVAFETGVTTIPGSADVTAWVAEARLLGAAVSH
jgi:predicted molibdopterin-dependent oxidoreductase YjgC